MQIFDSIYPVRKRLVVWPAPLRGPLDTICPDSNYMGVRRKIYCWNSDYAKQKVKFNFIPEYLSNERHYANCIRYPEPDTFTKHELVRVVSWRSSFNPIPHPRNIKIIRTTTVFRYSFIRPSVWLFAKSTSLNKWIGNQISNLNRTWLEHKNTAGRRWAIDKTKRESLRLI